MKFSPQVILIALASIASSQAKDETNSASLRGGNKLSLPFTNALSEEWAMKGECILGEANNNHLGYAVAVSDDGDIFVAGSPGDNSGASSGGSASVFSWNGSSWDLSHKFQSSFPNEFMGAAVAISADGSTIAVGSPGSNSGGASSGITRIFEKDGDTWVQKGTSIGETGTSDYGGFSVGLNAAGDVLVIGSPNNNDSGRGSGLFRVFTFYGGDWVLGETVHGAQINDKVGWNVDVTADGTTAIEGAPFTNGKNPGSGQVVVIKKFEDSWTQVGSPILGESNNEKAGQGVAISDDGTIIAIGAPGSRANGNDSGATRTYKLTNGEWVQFGQEIEGQSIGDNAGFTVSLNSDGTILAMTAPFTRGSKNQAGMSRIFSYDAESDEWVQLGESIYGQQQSDQMGFGMDLSASGTTIILGAVASNTAKRDGGKVCVYELKDSTSTAELE